MRIDYNITPLQLIDRIWHLWELSARKILAIENSYDALKGTPVYTVNGKYTSRGWTEWTQGFMYGSATTLTPFFVVR